MMQTAKKSFKAVISAHVLTLYYETVNNSLRASAFVTGWGASAFRKTKIDYPWSTSESNRLRLGALPRVQRQILLFFSQDSFEGRPCRRGNRLAEDTFHLKMLFRAVIHRSKCLFANDDGPRLSSTPMFVFKDSRRSPSSTSFFFFTGDT